MAFLSGDSIRTAVQTLITESDQVDIAVAFWGAGASEELADSLDPKRHRARLLCELESGSTNPHVIQTLLDKFLSTGRITIRHVPGLHAKVYLGDHAVIAGSANASSTGIGNEGDELVGWSEAALSSERAEDLSEAREWFDSLWGQSLRIDENTLKTARRRWQTRRVRRPVPLGRGSLLQIVRNYPHLLVDRLWFAVLPSNTEGHNEVQAKVDEVQAQLHEAGEFDYYWGWPEVTRQLPRGAQIVNLAYDGHGQIESDGVALYELIDDEPRQTSDGHDYAILRHIDPPNPPITHADTERLNARPLKEAIWRTAYPHQRLWGVYVEGPGVLNVNELRELLVENESNAHSKHEGR